MTNRIYQLVAETLGLAGPQQISADSSTETHPEWNSMAQVNLAVVLESEYGISLSVDDITRLTSIYAVGDILRQHGIEVQTEQKSR